MCVCVCVCVCMGDGGLSHLINTQSESLIPNWPTSSVRHKSLEKGDARLRVGGQGSASVSHVPRWEALSWAGGVRKAASVWGLQDQELEDEQ